MSSDSSQRTRPMRILALGLCRTGTTSLKAALEILGCFHIYDVGSLWDRNEIDFWTSLTRAKRLGKTKNMDMRKVFDSVLGDCDGIADIPAAIFADELRAAYPEAKIILSTRTYESWHRSMLSTVVNPYNYSLFFRGTGLINWKMRRFFRFMDEWNKILWDNDFEKNGKRVFEEHHHKVRGMVKSKNDILEFYARDGWGPLCTVLGNPEMPQQPYPHINTTRNFMDGDILWAYGLYKSVLKWVGCAVLAVVVAYSCVLWRN